MANSADQPDRIEAAPPTRRLADVADDALATLDTIAKSWVGGGEHGPLVMGILRSVILKSFGCTCTPGREPGDQPTYPEDLYCPLHGSNPVDVDVSDVVSVRRVWRVRDMDSDGSYETGSLEAAEAHLAQSQTSWMVDPPSQALETAVRIHADGVAVVTGWKTIRVVHPADE